MKRAYYEELHMESFDWWTYLESVSKRNRAFVEMLELYCPDGGFLWGDLY